jgi:hypothetical protein
MGGFMLYDGNIARRPLQLEELEEMHNEGQVEWPKITESEIQDRSKGDTLSKGIVILQTSWFLGQCIARGTTGLAITELELMTLAFASLNIVTYFFWWNKPVDVRYPELVHSKLVLSVEPDPIQPGSNPSALNKSLSDRVRDAIMFLPRLLGPIRSSSIRLRDAVISFPHSLSSLFSSIASTAHTIRSYHLQGTMSLHLLLILMHPVQAVLGLCKQMLRAVKGKSSRTDRVSTFYAARLGPNVFPLMALACSIIGTAFGGIHCIAWSFQFPSHQEQMLWRISSTIITCGPPLIAYVSSLFPRFRAGQTIFEIKLPYYIWRYVSSAVSNFYHSCIRHMTTPTSSIEKPHTWRNSQLSIVTMAPDGFDHVVQYTTTLAADRSSIWTLDSSDPLPPLNHDGDAISLASAAQSIWSNKLCSWRVLFGAIFRAFLLFLLASTVIVYIAARLALFVQAFLALRALSPSALQDMDWTSVIPHF